MARAMRLYRKLTLGFVAQDAFHWGDYEDDDGDALGHPV